MESVRDFSEQVCGLRDNVLWKDATSALFADLEECTDEIRGYLFLAWAIVCVVGVPMQIFVVTFFKAFRDNIADRDAQAQFLKDKHSGL